MSDKQDTTEIGGPVGYTEQDFWIIEGADDEPQNIHAAD